MVGLGNLKLIFKVSDSAKTAHNNSRVNLFHVVYQQPVKGCDGDIWYGCCHLFYHTNTFLKRKQRIFCDVIQHANHQFVHNFGRALDNVHVSERERIKTAWVNCLFHRLPPAFAKSGSIFYK